MRSLGLAARKRDAKEWGLFPANIQNKFIVLCDKVIFYKQRGAELSNDHVNVTIKHVDL